MKKTLQILNLAKMPKIIRQLAGWMILIALGLFTWAIVKIEHGQPAESLLVISAFFILPLITISTGDGWLAGVVMNIKIFLFGLATITALVIILLAISYLDETLGALSFIQQLGIVIGSITLIALFSLGIRMMKSVINKRFILNF